jgi:hypothetical protein
LAGRCWCWCWCWDARLQTVTGFGRSSLFALCSFLALPSPPTSHPHHHPHPHPRPYHHRHHHHCRPSLLPCSHTLRPHDTSHHLPPLHPSPLIRYPPLQPWCHIWRRWRRKGTRKRVTIGRWLEERVLVIVLAVLAQLLAALPSEVIASSNKHPVTSRVRKRGSPPSALFVWRSRSAALVPF